MYDLFPNDRPKEYFPRRLAAIAFLDVVGYSRLMGLDEEATLYEWSDLRREIIEPRVQTWRGRVVDRAGDGLFVEFHSALNAFRWALDVQAEIGPRIHLRAPMQVRIALHLGDVIEGPEGEVQGDGVNIAARLQAYAEAGGVIVSQAIANEVRGRTDADFVDLGELCLKNILRPVHAFQLRAPGAEPITHETAVSNPTQRIPGWTQSRFTFAIGSAALLLLLTPPILSHWRAWDSGATVAAANPVVPSPSSREEAIRLLHQARAIGCPQHPCPREWLAARDLYKQAIAADPDYAPPYAEATFTYTNFVTSGLSLNDKEDLRAAEQLAIRAAALAPEQALSHEARAAVLRQDPDRLEDALSAYLRSLAIKPNQPSVRANAGWMLVLLGRPAEAEGFLRGALAEAPGHLRASAWMTYLGLAELFLDREGHGAGEFRQALAQQSAGATASDVGLQRNLSLAAALALNGASDEAHSLVDDLRRQHQALSTRSLTLWNCRCSHEPGFVAGLDRLRRGLILAGVVDVP